MATTDILALVSGVLGVLTGIAGLVSAVLANRRASAADDRAETANRISREANRLSEAANETARSADLTALRSLALQRGLAGGTWEVVDGEESGKFFLYNKSVEVAKKVELEVLEADLWGERIDSDQVSEVEPHRAWKLNVAAFAHADGAERAPVVLRVSWVTADGVKLVTALDYQPPTWG